MKEHVKWVNHISSFLEAHFNLFFFGFFSSEV